ncbi:MAG: phosphoribosylanthranilate isomerase [Proteobacteria bacterium]|nr:phosphoribosylanthranilate isomerase [Pseudomonadota bacterium]
MESLQSYFWLSLGCALASESIYGKTLSIMDQQKKTEQPVLKICGIMTVGDTLHCLRRGVPYVGFNFYPGSKRFIQPETAAEVWRQALASSKLRVGTQPVAVVVDTDKDADIHTLEAAIRVFPELQVVQVHECKQPGRLRAYRQVLGGRPLWVALAVRRPEDVDAAMAYQGSADLLLFDSAVVAAGSKVPGGSGQSFDWQLLKSYMGSLPFGVAGGLRPENVADLARTVVPALVDLCSGVESQPGIKDLDLIDTMITKMSQLWAK